MVETEQDNATIQKVMSKVEEWYFSDGENSGEAMFNDFAAKHQQLFEDGCDAEEMENKLE